MPNWCVNRLAVSGPTAKVKSFVEAVTDEHGGLDFQKLVPMPEAVLNSKGDKWYDWALANWGTKWNVADESNPVTVEVEASDDKDSVGVWDFATAWSPPVPFVQKASLGFPELLFAIYFDEPGNCFSGVEFYQAGTKDEENSWELEDSLSWLTCAVEQCDNDCGGFMPWDFDGFPDVQRVRQDVFCSEHELVGAVAHQIRLDGNEDANTASNRERYAKYRQTRDEKLARDLLNQYSPEDLAKILADFKAANPKPPTLS